MAKALSTRQPNHIGLLSRSRGGQHGFESGRSGAWNVGFKRQSCGHGYLACERAETLSAENLSWKMHGRKSVHALWSHNSVWQWNNDGSLSFSQLGLDVEYLGRDIEGGESCRVEELIAQDLSKK